jgi:hypothetical protein
MKQSEKQRERAHFMQSMDRFHATTLQQHSGSCESQWSPDVVVGECDVKFVMLIVSVRRARI